MMRRSAWPADHDRRLSALPSEAGKAQAAEIAIPGIVKSISRKQARLISYARANPLADAK
jgi:hypothetical protein